MFRKRKNYHYVGIKKSAQSSYSINTYQHCMPYKDPEKHRAKSREHGIRPEVKARRKERSNLFHKGIKAYCVMSSLNDHQK